MQPLAFVDLETTGGSATHDRITEIGIVLVDESVVREWSQLVNPQARIPVFIEQMTGITNAMVANAPQFEAVAEEVAALLRGYLFIAHNARFDYGFLKNEFKRLGMTFQPTVLCTVKLSRTLYPEYRHHNLDSLIERAITSQPKSVPCLSRCPANSSILDTSFNQIFAINPE